MTTPVNVNQLSLPSALQIGPGGELITFDASGNPVVIDPNAPGALTLNALNVSYDNTTSGLTATNLQDAIDELDTAVDNNTTSITNILNGTSGLEFLDLADTPADYTGQGGLFLRVNLGETGLEFAAGGGGGGDFLSLTDTPGSYAGTAGQIPIVNPGETGLIFEDAATVVAGAAIGASIDTVTYIGGVDYNNPGPDDTLAVPTPPAGGENELFVFFDGIFQNNSSWALINGGNDIQFDANIPNTVSEIEIRQLVAAGSGLTNMDDVLVNGPFGDPEDIPLPLDPGVIENVWIYYNGIQQYPDPLVFSLQAGPVLRITGGVPAGVDEIYVKVGSTSAAPAFDIDALPAAGVLAGTDALALSQGGTESQTDLSTLSTFVGTALAGTLGGLIGIQSFTSSGTYNATPGTQAVLVFCTAGGGAGSNSGTNGGTSSFGAFCSASGGIGGASTRLGGSGSGGIINISGGNGGRSVNQTGAGGNGSGAYGGASFWGGGGSNTGNGGTGAGQAYGSGGGGTFNLLGNGDGDAGGAGGTSIDFITSGFDGTSVTIGAGGTTPQPGDGGFGAPGIVVVFEFG